MICREPSFTSRKNVCGLFQSHFQGISFGHSSILYVGVPSLIGVKAVFAPTRTPVVHKFATGSIFGISKELTVGTAAKLSLFGFFIHDRLSLGYGFGEDTTHIDGSVVVIDIVGGVGIGQVSIFGTGYVTALIERIVEDSSRFRWGLLEIRQERSSLDEIFTKLSQKVADKSNQKRR